MSDYKDKNKLLADMQEGFNTFEALLGSLDEKQLITAGVNGSWSIKDNLAHLSAWQRYAVDALHAVQKEVEFTSPWKSMEEDEINEQIYQTNKDRSLEDVRSEFRATYQLLRDRVLVMTGEELNRPYINGSRRLWETVEGNSYEHYNEHGNIIRRWLEQQAGVETR